MYPKEPLLASARSAAALNAASRPLTAACAAGVAASLEAGDPSWWREASEAWERQRLPGPAAGLERAVTALHFEALSGAEEAAEVSAQLPTCNGKPTGGLAIAVRDFLARPPARFIEHASNRQPRPFNLFAATQWLYFSGGFFKKRKLSHHFVELGSPAGLAACADLSDAEPTFNRGYVESRVAIDEGMLDIAQDETVRWLLASHLPDDEAGVELCSELVMKAREAIEGDAKFLHRVESPLADGPATAGRLLPPKPGLGLLVVSTRVRERLSEELRPRWEQAMAALVAPWEERALWVDCENGPQSATVTLRRMRGGQLASHQAVTVTGVGQATTIAADADAIQAFLA